MLTKVTQKVEVDEFRKGIVAHIAGRELKD